MALTPPDRVRLRTQLRRPLARRSAKARPEQGMALAGTMLALLFIVAVGLVGYIDKSNGDMSTRSNQSLRSSRRRASGYIAENLSETGVRMATLWLMNQATAPLNTTAFAPGSFYGATATNNYAVLTVPQGQSGETTNGQVKVRFYPYASNTTNTRKMFLVEAIGEYDGLSHVTRAVIKQNSFARFAYFSDKAFTAWWMAGNTRFQGPVHINGSNSAGTAVDTNAYAQIMWRNYSASTNRIFSYAGDDYFTTAMSSSQLKWYQNDGTSYWAAAPTSTSQWDKVTLADKAPKTGVPIIPMPTSNTDQRNAALGGATATTSIGVQVPNSGGTATAGIYINGDITDMNLSATGTGSANQVIVVSQTSGSTNIRSTITISRTTGQTILLKETKPVAGSTWTTVSTNTYTGETNGVIYLNGNVGNAVTGLGGLSGVVANNVMSGSVVTKSNSLNIVTENTKNINIDGGIVYQNKIGSSANANNITSTATSATSTSGTLGIVANTVQVTQLDSGGLPITDISVHATVMANDTFEVMEWDTRVAGTFKLLGGYIVRNNGNFGQFDPNLGTMRTGLNANRNYDQRVADNPPPFFPSAGTSYQITSFQRVAAPLQ